MVNINKDIYSSVKKVDKRWIKKFNLAKAYYEKNGNLDIGYTCNNEDELSIFLYKQRFLYRKNMLSEDKIELLNCLEIEWDYLYREASILCDELLSNYEPYKYNKLKNILSNNNYSDIQEKFEKIIC